MYKSNLKFIIIVRLSFIILFLYFYDVNTSYFVNPLNPLFILSLYCVMNKRESYAPTSTKGVAVKATSPAASYASKPISSLKI